MKQIKDISILGCGWIGFPLAKHLISKDYLVKGSTTSKAKFSMFEQNNIAPFYLNINSIDDYINPIFFDVDLLIFSIPPSKIEDIHQKINHLKKQITSSRIKNIILLSSTGIYRNTNNIVYEDALIDELETGKNVYMLEKLFQEIPDIDLNILRLGGLIGPQRHPFNFLNKKSSIKNSNSRVNYVQQIDVIKIISLIIQKGIWGDIFNCCMDEHPTKKDLLTKIALESNQPIPKFNGEDIQSFKIVDNTKVKKILTFNFTPIKTLYQL